MTNRIRTIRSVATVVAMFIVVATPAFAADLDDVAKEGKEKVQELINRISNEERKEIYKANDLKLKAREPLFEEQANARAKGLRETAEIVARQGGDVKPLLDAADYFERESELISKSKGYGDIPDGGGQIPHVHVHKHAGPGAAPAH